MVKDDAPMRRFTATIPEEYYRGLEDLADVMSVTVSEALREALGTYLMQHHWKGVLHCFTGTRELARTCLDLGFYLSFSGILTFKKVAGGRSFFKTFLANLLANRAEKLKSTGS